MMIKCTVTPGNTYRTDAGLFGAGDTVYLPLDEAKQAEGVLHFEEPPEPITKIEVKEES